MPLAFPYAIDSLGRTASPPDVKTHARWLIEQVLLTNPGERVNRPTLGAGSEQLLFGPASEEMAAATQHLVQAALQRWLSGWIELRNVTVTAVDSELSIHIVYALRETGESDELTVKREP